MKYRIMTYNMTEDGMEVVTLGIVDSYELAMQATIADPLSWYRPMEVPEDALEPYIVEKKHHE